MIKTIEGNLFDTTAPVIAHQVNCKGVMGSGVARQIKKKYPDVFYQYQSLCHANYPKMLLGLAQPCHTKTDSKIIVNLFGQETYGYDDTNQYTDVSALIQSLYGLKYFMYGHKEKRIALAYRTGCARGGANWDKEVYPAIRAIFLGSGIDIELWELPEGVNDNEL